MAAAELKFRANPRSLKDVLGPAKSIKERFSTFFTSAMFASEMFAGR